MSNLQPSDEGTYQCNAQNPESQNVREHIDVKIEGNLETVTVTFTRFQIASKIRMFEILLSSKLKVIWQR